MMKLMTFHIHLHKISFMVTTHFHFIHISAVHLGRLLGALAIANNIFYTLVYE